MTDIHTHFFNLKYLPVAGIIRRYSSNIVPHVIAIGVERLLLRGTHSSIPLEEREDLIPLPSGKPVLIALNKKRPDGEDKHPLLLNEEESINRILNQISEPDIYDELVVNALECFQAIETEGQPDTALLDFVTPSSPVASLEQSEKKIDLIGRLLHWIARKMRQGVNYIKWFGFMQHSEHALVKHISEIDEVGVGLFVHELMDVDSFFNDRGSPHKYASYFDYDLQVRKMEKLNNEFPDKLAGLVAFNPSKANNLEIVKNAIEKHGFKGVKFYPPMGYKPFGDENYRGSISQLFDYCIEKDIPVFTHCNNGGFEAYPKLHSGYCSNPMHWKQLLEQPKYHELRLCLAHAGGTEGWFTKVKDDEEIDPNIIKDLPPKADDKQDDWNSSYAKIVYKLCLDHPNVYCDAAYLDDVTAPALKNNFKERLQKLFTASPDFSKKIIYGSDWHMLFQEGKNNRYFKDYKDLFNDAGFTEEQRNDFFDKNAKAYLKI